MIARAQFKGKTTMIRTLLLSAGLIVAADTARADAISLVPPNDNYPQAAKAMAAYADQAAWAISVEQNDSGKAEAVTLRIPSPFKQPVDPKHSQLPLQPEASIYRFKYLDIAGHSQPFQFLEVDWNTEGQPRGPNGSFVNAHFDFHFYLRPRRYLQQEVNCPSKGKTCDAFKTSYAQMQRFLWLPDAPLLPEGYAPDSGSPIAQMGLHNLDAKFDYTIKNVNHNPVIIYGSFDNQLLFLEASLTLFAFQDALAQPGETLSWEIRQPAEYMLDWWPSHFTLTYLSSEDVFVLKMVGQPR